MLSRFPDKMSIYEAIVMIFISIIDFRISSVILLAILIFPSFFKLRDQEWLLSQKNTYLIVGLFIFLRLTIISNHYTSIAFVLLIYVIFTEHFSKINFRITVSILFIIYTFLFQGIANMYFDVYLCSSFILLKNCIKTPQAKQLATCETSSQTGDAKTFGDENIDILGLSHDTRNLLHSLSASLHILKDTILNLEENLYFQNAFSTSDLLGQLMDEFLKKALHTDQEQVEFLSGPLDLLTFFKSTWRLISPRIKDKKLRGSIKLERDCPLSVDLSDRHL
jgi:hypothetical protein